MTAPTTPGSLSPSAGQLVIFVLAGAVMLLEVALTRLFSFVTFYHMTYLVIGAGMLGFGAAGTRLSLRAPAADETMARARLARESALFAAAALLALFAIPRIHFYPIHGADLGDAGNLLALASVIVLSALPFFFAGSAIADLLGRAGASVNRLYGADLVGSASGSLLCLLLIDWLGVLATCVVAAALALVAAALAAPARRRVYAVAALALAGLSPVVEIPGVLPLTVPPGKHMYGRESTIEKTVWHPITRLDVGGMEEVNCSFGGALSPKYDGRPPTVHLIYQDGSNLTGIIHPTPTPKETPVLGYYVQGAAFRLRPGAKGLVIGSGGGVDVMVGLHHGARHVVAVDVNPKTMALVRGEYAEFAGGVFNSPQVEPVVSEGRHFLSRDGRSFDVIQLSGVDTWTALSSGAVALTENFIYTAEAFDEYLRHLTPDGILGFSRPHGEPPLETLRLAATALAALERRGVAEAYRHLLVVAGTGQGAPGPWAELLVKRSPFTEREAEALRSWAAGLDFEMVFDPFVLRSAALDYLSRSSRSQRRTLLEQYDLDVTPVTDDAPFPFQYHRWKDLFGKPPLGLPPPGAMWVLAASLVQVIVLSALFILLPLRRLGATPGAGRFGRSAIFIYFASLGAGFIFVEIGLLSKLTIFLGGPAYALAITLFTLLSASGLGSLLSSRRASEPLSLLGWVVPVAAGLVALLAMSLDAVTARLLWLPLAGRAAATVLLVSPVGLLLGMLFPAGLRHLDAVRPELKPWAWGINACATVVGTSLCMILVTAHGFRFALFVGAGVYLAGYAALRAGAVGKSAVLRGGAG